MPNSNVDTREMVRLYVEEELSVREIATRFGSAYGRIYGLLRNRVIMRDSNGRGPRRKKDHLRVAELIRERIVTGDWPPNRKILGQHELAAIFDVPQQTVRDALTHLRHRGYVTTAPNRGNYVRPPREWERGKQRNHGGTSR